MVEAVNAAYALMVPARPEGDGSAPTTGVVDSLAWPVIVVNCLFFVLLAGHVLVCILGLGRVSHLFHAARNWAQADDATVQKELLALKTRMADAAFEGRYGLAHELKLEPVNLSALRCTAVGPHFHAVLCKSLTGTTRSSRVASTFAHANRASAESPPSRPQAWSALPMIS